MSDYDFKYRAPEALEKLRAIILKVAPEKSNPPDIIPTFLSLTYGGYEDQWHHAYANFMCSVEFKQDDVDSQIRALKLLKRLSEHIAANEDEWTMPFGSKSVKTKWHKAPAQPGDEGRRPYHLQVTESSIMDSVVSEDGAGGAFSVNLNVGPLQMNYTTSRKPKIGLLVNHRHRTRKQRLSS